MRNIIIFCTIIFSTSFDAQQISVMTYNIKLDYPKDGDTSWTARKGFFIDQLKFYEPDILGVQEALPNQMTYMDSLLVEYNFVGVGRDDGKNEGEHSAIFYKADYFKVMESATFWLSETPEKVSLGWDAAYKRVCTYTLFKNLKTEKMFWVFNTHLDHVGATAQIEGVKLILNKIKLINTQNSPIILMGDFNMEDTHESMTYILKSLNDSKSVAKNTFGPSGTFNNFEFHKPVTRRIDYIFLSEDITVNKYAVLSDSKDGHYPSDHLPVLIYIAFKE